MMSEKSDEDGYYAYYELSGEESEEHIYCEVQDLQVIFTIWCFFKIKSVTID
jgi:hypothetical protein